MTKVLGIDYGTKRVGVAISDETGTIAFPKKVLVTNDALIDTLKDICAAENVGTIVIGESRAFSGEHNTVASATGNFQETLAQEIQLPVVFQDEFLSSVEARKVEHVIEERDAHAAAIILQRFLDRKKHE